MTYWVTLCTGADHGSPAIALADQPDRCWPWTSSSAARNEQNDRDGELGCVVGYDVDTVVGF